MLVLAISAKDHEYLYNARTAHAVSKASAEKIRDALNAAGYMLKPGQVWHIHDVAEWEAAGIYAGGQSFKKYRGSIRRYH